MSFQCKVIRRRIRATKHLQALLLLLLLLLLVGIIIINNIIIIIIININHKSSSSSPGKGEDIVQTLTMMADQRLYKLVKWCKSLPLFKNILIDDQVISWIFVIIDIIAIVTII